MRKFNVAGNCIPNMHYMVDISEKIDQIFLLVEDSSYFTINRGRQYGKTTTIGRLKKRLIDEGSYICASISFQYSKDKMFADEEGFCQGFLSRIYRSLLLEHKEEAKLWFDENVTDFEKLDIFISERSSGKKIVLMIDEADEASNNNLFVRFLKMLRDKYLFRNAGEDYTFHSVILAGVYDIRNLKQKMILQGNYTPSLGESAVNSPWNIAVDFKIDMSFSAKEIETMLVEYENDHNTGMNISELAHEIRFYTSGYPYLVSKICQLIEIDLDRNWSAEGVQEAIKLILNENSTLFEDLFKKIEENQDLQNLLYFLTIDKKEISYNVHDPTIKVGLMFSFLDKNGSKLSIHNKIFEIAVTDYFISRNITTPKFRNVRDVSKNEIIKDEIFDMELCIRKFQKHYSEIYTDKDLKFLERDGKLIFLTYLKPLINGLGFYHFESETRDFGKMDLVVDFLKQQFIIELKRWYGDSKHQDAYEQLADYLKSKNMDCGYLITYDFRKKRDPMLHETQWINWKGKRIFDVILRVGEEDSD
ncbi:MAG: AAA-like domain-containing protein [Marinilabiliaceae bacterium]|nr:AAA-like domain-containing protein [Marinilabiliaceae bacterium]